MIAVFCGVAAKAHTPTRLFEFLTDLNLSIIGYWLEKLLIWVSLFKSFLGFFRVELLTLWQVARVLRRNMRNASVLQDIRLRVDPHGGLAHLNGAWHLKRLVFFTFVGDNIE